jgi:crotonobetainyl-CoA:carnitine CoA-transferase CaiB-like acyl-CoA transferase
MTQPLDNLVVLDFSSGRAGSVATMVLSDFGAEVIKVEPPEGDPYRVFPQALLWNRGKKSVNFDLKSAEGKESVRRLMMHADVVVESFRPGEADALGIGYDDVSAQRPDIVYCSITAFGPKGPYAQYKAYDAVVAAKVGRFSVFTGQSGRPGPHYAAVEVASHGTAMAAVRGILSAIIVREKTGQGQRVETSLMQGISPFDVNNWLVWQMMINFPDRFQDDPQSDPNRQPGVGYQPIRTKDGQWIQMANIIVRLFRETIDVMGLGDVLKEPGFERAPTLMPEEREELREMVLKRAQEKTLDEWMDIFVNETSNVAAEPFLTTQEGMSHPQILHNHHIEEVDDPTVGKMRQVGALVRLSETPGSIKGPAPRLGEHNEEVLRLLETAPVRGGIAPATTALPTHPLTGYTVLDLSTVIAGPLSTSLNYELGARVIRIETLDGDTMRRNFDGLGANRTQAGAENISINLQTPEGKEIFDGLAAKADILVHNMRPGAPERLGIGYEQVRKFNPGIVYVYAGGYGDSGPHSHRPAMHPIGGAVLGGVMNQLGRGIMPPPEQPMSIDEIKEMARRLGRANETNPDPNSSMVISTGALLGLCARERFGVSQYVLSTMIGANAYANVEDFFSYEGKPERLISDSDGHGPHALYRLYEAGRGWVFLACLFEEEWRALCGAINKDDLLNDPRFENAAARLKNDDALVEELEKVFNAREPGEWERILVAVDVACVEVEESGMFNFYSQDPHVAENDFIQPAEGLRIGKYWRYGPVVNLSRTPARVGSGPLRGQHTRSLLKEIGYSEAQIEELYQKQVVDSEEPTKWDEEAGH